MPRHKNQDAENARPPGEPNGTELGAERWPIGRLLTWTTDFLKRRGSESPRLDAEVLLAHVLGRERVQLYTHFDEEIEPSSRGTFRDLVRRRAEGSPVAYLVGRKEFYSLPLRVSPAVLIPRPDSEFVVVEYLAAFKERGRTVAVDVGTGSGCLALACAQQHKISRFYAIDKSPEALEVAAANARALGLAERVEFRQGHLLEPVAELGPFDAIVANPPYIPTDVIPTLEPGVRDYEPHSALDGGPDGLRVVSELVAQATPLLKAGGHLILEIGTAQEQPVRGLVEAQHAYRLLPTVRDHANHPRVIHAVRNG